MYRLVGGQWTNVHVGNLAFSGSDNVLTDNGGIATFVQTPTGWRMTSNANFNAP